MFGGSPPRWLTLTDAVCFNPSTWGSPGFLWGAGSRPIVGGSSVPPLVGSAYFRARYLATTPIEMKIAPITDIMAPKFLIRVPVLFMLSMRVFFSVMVSPLLFSFRILYLLVGRSYIFLF